jgi:hypothetical protein
MQDLEFKTLWKSYSEKLEQSLIIHRQTTEEITKIKVQSLISSLKPIKIFTLLAGLLWSIPLGYFLIHLFLYSHHRISPFFLYSMTLQVGLTLIATAVYLHQLDLIYRVDFSMPVIRLQETLSRLKSSTLLATRILFLQLPCWTTFYLTTDLLRNGPTYLLIFQGLVTLLFTIGALWLFFNIDSKNRHKNWFQWLFKGNEWTPLLKSMDLLDQLEEIKSEEKK